LTLFGILSCFKGCSINEKGNLTEAGDLPALQKFEEVQNCMHTPGSFLLTVQVLDDSTCAATRQLVDEKVLEWRERGVCVTCVRRTNRQGYKAGALKEVSIVFETVAS